MFIWRFIQLMTALLMVGSNAWAVDSYRFLHVTIDTPWYIFIFLFFLVFSPMILSAIIHWRNALKRDDEDDEEESGSDDNNKHG